MSSNFKTQENLAKLLKKLKFQNLAVMGFMLLIALSSLQCANMQKPTGGPKDSLPPKLLNESPANFGRNFKDKQIILTFDEFIKMSNQFKEFSISPDVDDPLDYKVRKKNLVISLPDSLEENTTYTLNFGKGLVDYNEGNPIINYTYVFATGDQLDSLSISGTVKNGFTKSFDSKTDTDIKMLLIPTRQDSIFGKRKANIFVNVDTSGNFKFNNLRADTYRIYALKEQNNDRIFNGNDEWLGFLHDSLVLDRNIAGLQLEITKGKPRLFKTLDRKIEKNGSLLLTFNTQLVDPKVSLLFPEDIAATSITKFNTENDSAFIYIANQPLDSIKLELSEQGKVLDTIMIRTNKNMKFDRELRPQLNITNKVDLVKHIQISSTTPIASIDKNKLILTEDSVSRRNFQLQQDSINTNLYHVRFNWKPKRNYELIIQDSAIVSPFNDTNKKLETKFTLNESDNYGDIKFVINGLDPQQQYIVELIDEEKVKVYDKRIMPLGENTLTYLKFPGGKYSLRIIFDTNKNGRWDGADIYENKQAENIWYLNKTFTIRANWEQNETITVAP